MSSQMTYGSTLFSSIDEDLNASLATADALSQEFNSLLQECGPSNQMPETPAKRVPSEGTPQSPPTINFPSSPDNGGSSHYTSAGHTHESSPHSYRERISYSHRSDSDSGVSYGRLSSPNQSPGVQRRASPAHLAPYNGRQRSPSPKAPMGSGFDQSPRMARLSTSMVQSGQRSPQRGRSPSPRRYSQPVIGTLPHNFVPFKPNDEGAQRPKIPTKWNETDLDVAYERKPHHTYDKSEWLRPSVPNSNWRESNLDAPPPAPRKDSQPRSGQHGYMPHNVRVTVTPDSPSSPHGSATYSPQPIISRISIPPSSPRVPQRRPIPLSVIMRLQNPQYFSSTGPHPPQRMPGPVFLPQEYLPQPPPPELRQPGVYGEVLAQEDVEMELEKVEPARGLIIPESTLGKKKGVPRPLSPTRLQPIVAPEMKAVSDQQELLRVRAEIPRALKRRGSIDQSRPQAKGQYKQVISKLFRRKEIRRKGEPVSDTSSSSEGEDSPTPPPAPSSVPSTPTLASPQHKGTNSILRKGRERGSGQRAHLSPLVLLLDGALVGELETVQRAVQEMSDPSQANDEGITALHNAICGGHYAVVDFLVRIGANVSAPDSHGWTPLHCAASCNDLMLCEYLVRNGAAVMAVTESDGATAAQKCDPFAVGYQECESFLRGVEEAMGVENSGVLYALWGYPAQAADELSFREGDMVTILQKPEGMDWWWASLCGTEGFVPDNFFGLFPKVRPKSLC